MRTRPSTCCADSTTGELRVSAKDRLTQSGDFAITSVAGSKLTARSPSATSIENYTGTQFAFQNGTALKEGETFTAGDVILEIVRTCHYVSGLRS